MSVTCREHALHRIGYNVTSGNQTVYACIIVVNQV